MFYEQCLTVFSAQVLHIFLKFIPSILYLNGIRDGIIFTTSISNSPLLAYRNISLLLRYFLADSLGFFLIYLIMLSVNKYSFILFFLKYIFFKISFSYLPISTRNSINILNTSGDSVYLSFYLSSRASIEYFIIKYNLISIIFGRS